MPRDGARGRGRARQNVFARPRGGGAWSRRPARWSRLGDARAATPTSERKRPRGLLDYDDLVSEGARSAAPAGRRAVGAVQARWRARPHPDRRGAGHQPRAMGDRRRAGRGVLRRRGRRATACARSLPSATPSSRSTAFSAPTREPSCAMRRHFEQRVDAARQEWRVVPLEISFRSTEPLLQAVDAVFRQRGGATASRSTAARSAISRPAPATPGWSSCGRRSPAERRGTAGPDGAAGRSPARAEPRTRLASAIAATIEALARQRRAAGGARPPDPAGRHHGAGAAPQRLRRRPAARA